MPNNNNVMPISNEQTTQYLRRAMHQQANNASQPYKSSKNIMHEKISELEKELKQMPNPPTFKSNNLRDNKKKSEYLAAMKQWREKSMKLSAELQQLKINLQKYYEWDVAAHEGRSQ